MPVPAHAAFRWLVMATSVKSAQMHEEFFRGTLGEAAEEFQSRAAKVRSLASDLST